MPFKTFKNQKNLYKTWAYVLLISLASCAFSAQAETKSLSNPTSVVSIFLSLLLVIAVVFMLAYLMRRFNVTQGGSSQLKVVASMMAGTRERVMVIEVGDEQHLIGVTGQNINHLARLETPLNTDSTPSGESFKRKLSQFMSPPNMRTQPTEQDK